MPNTIAHFGIHGVISRSAIKEADYKWIYLACLIPDIPWIFQRILKTATSFDPFDIRIYTMIQASLFMCIILSAGLSLLSSNSKKTFLILGLGSLLHLLLDAAQYKWANGVHLFAPFSWQLTNYGFFWPSDFLTFAITSFGLGYYIFNWRRYSSFDLDLNFQFPKLAGVIFFAILYFAAPVFLIDKPFEADNHFIKTLVERENRPGKYIEIDRCTFEPSTNKLINFTQEDFIAEGIMLDQTSSISIKGIFIDQEKINVIEYKVNNQLLRDISSVLGILLLMLIWIKSFWDKLKRE